MVPFTSFPFVALRRENDILLDKRIGYLLRLQELSGVIADRNEVTLQLLIALYLRFVNIGLCFLGRFFAAVTAVLKETVTLSFNLDDSLEQLRRLRLFHVLNLLGRGGDEGPSLITSGRVDQLV